MEVIRTHSISKTFGSTHAVNEVSLHVNEGEIYGFVGLNGAGKTTTIRMLLGMISPTAGTALLFGQKVGSGINIWQDVGYLVEIPNSYPNLSVYENLRLYQRLRNLPGSLASSAGAATHACIAPGGVGCHSPVGVVSGV